MLAMICDDRGMVDKDKPCDQMTTVSYYKKTDEVNIRQSRTQSAPPEERSTEDAILKHLYPNLPGTKYCVKFVTIFRILTWATTL